MNSLTRAFTAMILMLAIAAPPARSHEGHSHDQAANTPEHPGSSTETRQREQPVVEVTKISSPADAFKAFSETLKLRNDGRYLYIESNGLPQHNMMVGIRSWQQQVPLPQPYTGRNAWQIPLQPKLAAQPISAKTNLFRGAIAIAVNGVPIFNALNNRGEDALLAGELDQWGGHCGRGDDYHYHVAPVHLEKTVGKGNPIAYALDGFPIYGYTEADGSDVGKLDAFNGQFDQDGNYHYHATETYPYINGGMRGEVTVRDGQIDPQPRDSPVRPAGQPLRGATITGFSRDGSQFRLDYNVAGRKASIAYAVQNDGIVEFKYHDPSGQTRIESYRRRSDAIFLPLVGDDSGPRSIVSADLDADLQKLSDTPTLSVSSSAFAAGGELPADFTCDGSGESPPVSWTKGPAGTRCYALNLWHVPGPGGVKSYWLLYDIPPDVTSLPRNARNIGTPGFNDKDRSDYDPMCSRGPGTKEYHITVYALSKKPDWPTTNVTRADLLRTIGEITLAEGTLSFQYTRPGTSSWLLIPAGVLLAIIVVYVARSRWTAHAKGAATTAA